MTQIEQFDIIVSGGGVAGLSAAAAFGTAGFDVLCVDPAPPVTERDAVGADLRTTAILQPGRAFLDAAGLWDRLAPDAMPLEIMRIIDAGGPEATPRVTKDFVASEVSDAPFGWNLPNWLLRRALVARLAELDRVTFRPGIATADVLARSDVARLRLSDGARAEARLIVAADGRNSTVRRALGISVKTRRYGQKALAFAVTHPLPHENISTEIHRSGGPFTLVPLPDHQGRPCSAVVWMESGPEAQRLKSLDTAAFEAEMNTRSCQILGPLTLISPLSIWPIISQIAERMDGPRTALVAEAAHVVPPIGAQGLNMSLADQQVLLDLALANPDALGGPEMLRQYHRRRYPEVQARVTGIDLLNRTSQLSAQPMRDVRAAGLNALYGLAPLRKTLMQLGLGVR